jgi:hypothetical protein
MSRGYMELAHTPLQFLAVLIHVEKGPVEPLHRDVLKPAVLRTLGLKLIEPQPEV